MLQPRRHTVRRHSTSPRWTGCIPSSVESVSSNADEAQWKWKKLTTYLLAGGTAGMVARTCIAPVERIKIIFQVNRGASMGSYKQLLPNLIRDEGFFALWAGNGAAVIRVVPYMSITFLGFEEYKRAFDDSGVPNTIANLLAGSLGGATAVLATYPLDLVRARLAMQLEGLRRPKYTGVWHALTTIPKTKGVLGLYRGITFTLAGVVPYAGLKFMTYEGMKGVLKHMLQVEESALPSYLRVGAGAMAGLVAQTFVYPFDVMRRRMQTSDEARALYRNPVDGLRVILREEGLKKGLFRGLTLNYMKTLPNVAIYMSLYDVIKNNILK